MKTLSGSYKHLKVQFNKVTLHAIMEERDIPVLYCSYYYLWGTDIQDTVPHVFQPHQSRAFILHNLAVLPWYQFVGWEGQITSWRENKVPSWKQENKWDRLCFLLFSVLLRKHGVNVCINKICSMSVFCSLLHTTRHNIGIYPLINFKTNPSRGRPIKASTLHSKKVNPQKLPTTKGDTRGNHRPNLFLSKKPYTHKKNLLNILHTCSQWKPFVIITRGCLSSVHQRGLCVFKGEV